MKDCGMKMGADGMGRAAGKDGEGQCNIITS
eukprot:CAMPEP_0184349710 /NCGR_PEP_ID=MMETSP1089-20130417/36423_1 /TAXON_ID=38269 ORGANISM="Gloeochaete wittrockiana, Strain SAG46.84" /NCGR_SAMPLE_ID=MMETSP1089 /ASSEMBLY_ACC=CAM_ASM_000445 /LENGTH=30 /DNA_ID= /DNA_START= /DNA_END= /DNA_ORIENTATION=